MNRIGKLNDHVNKILIEKMETKMHPHVFSHLHGVSSLAAMIAMKRGVNVELATMAGLLHDLYGFLHPDAHRHAHKGAEYAKELLEQLKITSEEETELVCQAIYNHSDKDKVGMPLDEVVKDADVSQHCLHNAIVPPYKKDLERFDNLKKEFGLL